MPKKDYSLFDKILHRLALNFNTIAELTFDLDQKVAGQRDVNAMPHVFVAGLARAGTTVLMRQLHACGQYRSLTYRDMPFVLAPNIWQKFSSISNRDLSYAERAHGDSLRVNLDSPESFDEVFWRVFMADAYLSTNHMIPHFPEEDLLEKYRRYIGALLASNESLSVRYLCKNNNNVLRLDGIYAAFPNAVILVPFRDPLQHANSLLKQHENFCSLQLQNKFVLSYMTWLGHHEFGRDHRPFLFPNSERNPYSPSTLDYWLFLWQSTYCWLEEKSPSGVFFVCYEDLCTNSKVWNSIAEIADCDADIEESESLSLSRQNIDGIVDQNLLFKASELYERLRVQSRIRLGV